MKNDADIYLPTLHSFANGNEFTGSWQSMRFRIKPNVVKLSAKEVNMEESSITVQYWHGPFCYEKSEMEGEKIFPMSQEGRAAIKQWLQENI